MDDDDCQCEEGAPPWMATFSDLATLLLTFFVLLLSFAELDIVEFRVMLGSVKDAFGVITVEQGPFAAASSQPIDLLGNPTSLNMPLNDMEATMMRPIRRYIDENEMQDRVELEISDQGVIVRMRDQVLFGTGSASVKSEATEILGHIGALAEAFPHGLSIEGHTDDRPIRTSRFPSNWELSAARASAVLRVMQRDAPLPVENLQVVGLADTKPIAGNDTDENRARNRRVEFVFERPPREARRTTAPDERDEDAEGPIGDPLVDPEPGDEGAEADGETAETTATTSPEDREG